MFNTTSEEASPSQKSKSQVAGLAKERGIATRANWRNKRDEDSKPGMNMKDPIQQH